MNISYEKSKLLKDINLVNLFNLLNPRTPLQMVSEPSKLKSTEEIYIELELEFRVFRVKNLECLELKIYLQKY